MSLSPQSPLGPPSVSRGFLPLTSTPLACSSPKLNQRRPQIRGHFRSSSSPLGVSAPALLGHLFSGLGSELAFCRRCFKLNIEGSIALRFDWIVQLFWSHDQILCHMTGSVMAATIAPSLGQSLYLRDLFLLFWFLFLSQKGYYYPPFI